MQSLDRVQEHGGLADAAQSGGDFLGDNARFADAGDEHFAGMACEQIDGPFELAIQARTGGFERPGFGQQDLARRLQ